MPCARQVEHQQSLVRKRDFRLKDESTEPLRLGRLHGLTEHRHAMLLQKFAYSSVCFKKCGVCV